MAINERNESKKKGKVKRNESQALKKYTHNCTYEFIYINIYVYLAVYQSFQLLHYTVLCYMDGKIHINYTSREDGHNESGQIVNKFAYCNIAVVACCVKIAKFT